MWLGRMWVIARLQKFIAKEKALSLCRYKSLQRACRRQELKGPNRMTQYELNIERKVCKKKLKELQHTAPYLRVCYLQKRDRAALAIGDVDKKERKSKH